jgi:hypothetical protein
VGELFHLWLVGIPIPLYHPDLAVTLSIGRTKSLVHGGGLLPEAWRIISRS